MADNPRDSNKLFWSASFPLEFLFGNRHEEQGVFEFVALSMICSLEINQRKYLRNFIYEFPLRVKTMTSCSLFRGLS